MDAFGNENPTVIQYADGDNPTVYVGGVHGNEPCGVAAISRYLEDNPDSEIGGMVANPRALSEDVRYIDEDLNRLFNGGEDPESEIYESRLAYNIRDCLPNEGRVVDFHSSPSFIDNSQMFGIVTDTTEPVLELIRRSGLEKVVDTSFNPGGMLSYPGIDGLGVESGIRGDKGSIEQAYQIISNIESDKTVDSDPVIYEAIEGILVSTADDEIIVDDFKQVEQDQVYAVRNGEPLTADESFQMVLGHADPSQRDIMGIKVKQKGKLSEIEGDGDER